ncbi:MAG: ribonuclease P protein component [bacterium]|nr:ribonuclease P protein component [bacterium]
MRRSSDFSRAYRIGRRRRCGPVTVITCDGPAGPPSVGFVAGKKVGSAVRRNRAKRRMREATARCQLRSDTVYVLIADSGVLAADFGSLIGWIDRCISKEPMVEDGA